MPKLNIAAKNQEEQDKVNVDLAASCIAYKELLNMPGVAELVAREQPEHLRKYFMERVRYYRVQSEQLPRASDPRYIEMAGLNGENKPYQFNPLRRVFFSRSGSELTICALKILNIYRYGCTVYLYSKSTPRLL